MGLSREDRIYLAYQSNKKALSKEGLDRVHARTLLYLSETFSMSPLKIQQIVDQRQKK